MIRLAEGVSRWRRSGHAFRGFGGPMLVAIAGIVLIIVVLVLVRIW
jgi:hypothetical protein